MAATAEYWTYKVLTKDYTAGEVAGVFPGTFGPTPGYNPDSLVTDRIRRIPIQSLQKGALLFHYFKLPTRTLGETDAMFQCRILDVFLGQFGIPISWQPATGRWRFCFGTVVTNYHYYYPNPCAGFGIAGYGNNFNAALICRTTRSSKWAYLKAGSSIRNDRVNHRRFPITTYRNYDYKRIKICSDIVNTGSCRPGNTYDICLTPEFQRENRIDGITSIAQMDDLMDITRSYGTYRYDTNKSMFRAIQSFWSKVQQSGNQEVDHLLWDMNLLCLESDYKPDSPRLNIGFREFANSPFGYEQRNPENIPPRNLPAEFGALNINYWITEEEYNGGTCVKRVFEVDSNNLLRFFQTYILNKLLVLPFSVITPWGSVNPNNPYELQPYIGNIQAGNPDDLRYALNNRMAVFLNEWATSNSLYFDLRLNVFFVAYQAFGYNPNEYLTIMFQFIAENRDFLPDGNPLKAPPHSGVGYPVGQYARLVSPTRAGRNIMMIKKYLHELISNTKWSTHWMYEIAFFFNPPSMYTFDNITKLPIGPYYNPFALPITAYADIPDVYREILRRLETVGGLVSNSGLLQTLNNPTTFNYMKAWALHQTPDDLTFSPPPGVIGNGKVYPYFLGWFFRDLYDANQLVPPSVHQGGKRKIKTRRSSRVSPAKANRRTRKCTFLSEPSFGKSLRKNLKDQSRNLSKKMNPMSSSRGGGDGNDSTAPSTAIPSQNIPNQSNIPNQKTPNQKTSNQPTTEETKDGHTSENIVPMNLDTFQTFQAMFTSPLFGPLLKSIFEPTDTSNVKTNL